MNRGMPGAPLLWPSAPNLGLPVNYQPTFGKPLTNQGPAISFVVHVESAEAKNAFGAMKHQLKEDNRDQNEVCYHSLVMPVGSELILYILLFEFPYL
jgi:hypothetical protein